jgi:hypothetical protein
MSDGPISIEMSNSLADLAARINAAHGSVVTTFKARSAQATDEVARVVTANPGIMPVDLALFENCPAQTWRWAAE